MRTSLCVGLLAGFWLSIPANADDLDSRYQACMSDDAHDPPGVKPRPMKWKPGFEHCEADFNAWHERDNASKADPSQDPPNVRKWREYVKDHPEKALK